MGSGSRGPIALVARREGGCTDGGAFICTAGRREISRAPPRCVTASRYPRTRSSMAARSTKLLYADSRRNSGAASVSTVPRITSMLTFAGPDLGGRGHRSDMHAAVLLRIWRCRKSRYWPAGSGWRYSRWRGLDIFLTISRWQLAPLSFAAPSPRRRFAVGRPVMVRLTLDNPGTAKTSRSII